MRKALGYEICYAVLTGDLIKSTKLSLNELERTRDALPFILDEFEHSFQGSIRGKPEFFRGDSWQVLLSAPGMALRVALFVGARWRSEYGADTRIAIGLGPASSIIESKISLSSGEAFVLSGQALDKMTAHFNITGAISKDVGPMAEWLPLMLHLCSQLTQGWTRRQAEIIATALLTPSLNVDSVTQTLDKPVSKQAIYKSLNSANWRGISDALRVFEETDWHLVINS